MAKEYKIKAADIIKWNENNVILHSVLSDPINSAFQEAQYPETDQILYFSAKEGYAIVEPPYADFSNGTKIYFTEIESTGVWSYKVVKSANYGISRGYDATTISTAPPAEIRYTFTSDDVQGFNAANVKARVDGVLVVADSVLREGQTLTLTTSTGYKFEYAQVSTDMGMMEVMTPNETNTIMTYVAGEEGMKHF